MAPEKHKRRQIVVDADIQVGLSMHILGWLYFYVVVFAIIANASSIWSVLTESSTDIGYYDAVQRMQWFTQFTVLPLALTFLCVAAHSVVFTHRIAGPIYRIKTVLRGMAQREYPPNGVKLRDKDYFKDVAAELTTVIHAIREDASFYRRENRETAETVRALVVALEAGDRPAADLVAQAKAALEQAERLDQHLAAVAVPPAKTEAASTAPASSEPAPQVPAAAAV
jgi:hypothetical protein